MTLGAQRRRFCSADEKQKIVAKEAMAPGGSIAEVARRHDVNPNLLFTWRRKARGKAAEGSGTVKLVPVVVTPETTPSASRMEIALISGERILVGADADAGALARIVKALSRR